MEIAEIDESCNLKLNNAILNYAYSRERYKFKLILQFTRKNCYSNHNLINKILYTGRRFYINELFKHFQENMTNNIKTQEFNTQAITVALSNGVISIAKPLFRIFEDKFIDSLEYAKELGLHPRNLAKRGWGPNKGRVQQVVAGLQNPGGSLNLDYSARESTEGPRV